MNKSRLIKRGFRLILAFLLFFIILTILDYSSFPQITSKSKEELLRIGYVNLHENQISKKDLNRFQKFNCDIWFFLEWNGNNLNLLPSFEKNYIKTFEKKDSNTYGFYVLSKEKLNLFAKEFDKANRPYKCDYSKIIIRNKNFKIAFIHAPPPVPTCEFQTDKYISDLLNHLKNESTVKNQMIIGDLNTTPYQSPYKEITQFDFKDAFNRSNLFNATYGGFSKFPKILRIDYMFYKGSISKVYSERFYLNNSDHCGLIADYKISN